MANGREIRLQVDLDAANVFMARIRVKLASAPELWVWRAAKKSRWGDTDENSTRDLRT